MLPLYKSVVEAARDPLWYREGQVPDTVSGRFDMLAAVTALVLVRMERLHEPEARQDAVLLTELFIADMDESLLEIGVGDYSVGKHVGRMVGALGGRLAAFREASQSTAFEAAVRRNIFHEAPPGDEALGLVVGRVAAFDRALADLSHADLVGGRLPRP